MSKTLVIAEKPSVGRDLARVLPGPFAKQEGWLEGPDHVVTWAVGHLVQLAEPDEYDAKYKRWRMPDLPIVPPKFKLVVRDERSRKQMSVVTAQLGREDVAQVVNACDAGREGELIFAYLYEKAKASKPVQRLWLNSMTNAAMKAAFGSLRPAEDFALLEQAARSRSEADWIVGMNATRAATIRLKSSFDGAVSLGRVQTPTLAIVARREEEIKAFVPEPYWLVDATFDAGAPDRAAGEGQDGAAGQGQDGASGPNGTGARVYEGRFHMGSKPRIATEQEALAIVEACQGKPGTITKLEKKEQRERAPLLYDLTSLQRDANTRYGFSARRTLAAAQRLYEEHKALTYPRTNSRYLTTDMVEEIKPTAELVGGQREYAEAAAYVTGLDVLPLARVVNDEKVSDHHAIIPTKAEHAVDRMGDDDKRVYDMVVRRFLAIFHPEAVFENTRIETTVLPAGSDAGGCVFRTRGKLLLVPGWRGVYGQLPSEAKSAAEEDEGVDQQLPKLEEGERVRTLEVISERKETKPPRRYSDASLLAAMETAGKLVDDDELREAMKDSGIGTPATRAAIIERLIQVGYLERDARSLVATDKGLNVIRLLGEHALTSPEMTGQWEHRLEKIERGEDSRERFMGDIAGFADSTVKELDTKLKDVRIPRANLGPCPICGHDIKENRKGYSCWSRDDPGCGFVIWKGKSGKQLSVAIAKELIRSGHTSKAVSGFKARSGRGFRAHLALGQDPEGKWRVEFNEPWAQAGAKPPDSEGENGQSRSPRAWLRTSGASARAGVVGGLRQDGCVPISLVTGPANAGKINVVLEALRGHLSRGEEPLLVVPTEADQARYRRELVAGGVVFGARVERFDGLLGEVLARVPGLQAPLRALARERALARIAQAPPSLARELATFVAELETRRVTPARLRGALGAWRATPDPPAETLAGLEHLADVYERYREALSGMARADAELRATAALDALRRKPALWGSRPVLLYGFDDLAELQLDAVVTLGSVVDAPVTVSLAYEPGRVAFAGRGATFQRIAPLAASHTELSAREEYYAPHAREALHHLERSLLTDAPRRVEAGDAVRLLEGGDPRAELELVAGEIRALLSEGVPAEEIAIVHRAPATIAGLLVEILEDYEVPFSLHRRVGFAHTAIGRGLLGLLRCALGEGDLADLLAWLRAPGALDHPELADRLEAQARRRGISDAAQARALWEAENWSLDRIDRLAGVCERGSISALVEVLCSELRRLLCAPRRAAAAVLGEDELDEALAAGAARRALEELADLARSSTQLAPAPRELAEALERLESDEATRASEGRIAIVDPLSLRARRVRMLFACGLQEGVFPASPRVNPLLGEDARRGLASASGLVLAPAPDALAAERYLLYALASRAEERLTLSWHTADEDGAPAAHSLFVDDVCELFTETLGERSVRRPAGAAAWPGPGEPTGAPSAREAVLDCGAEGVRPAPISPLRGEPALAVLHERVLWSASSLETWSGCPVRWFVERLLRADSLDPDPEPLARGALAHAALKETLERLRERTGSARVSHASLGLAKRLLQEALDGELHDRHPLSAAPERLPGARRRLAVDLERFLEYAAEQESPLEPTYLELEFGFAPDGPQPLELGDGILLRGRIDRVDVSSDGQAVVYDYKGRQAPPGASWAATHTFQVALYMRAVERLLGHSVAGGFYQPLAGRDIRGRGVLEADAGVELDCVRTDRIEPDELRALIDRCVELALEAASQARSGALEPRPDTCAFAGGCAYPTICRCER